ncbi:molybdopterin synthase sulfur carrier subunit [Halobacillus andaensis]|uniref:Molybdopterin synthase sulfur carrier subunit n=1 Tax=Halobacillus andaensis TaxID=1176239 RepID=A0A917B0P5_HALAA|nr:molybdopterin converting factor subunit 1 [Halobacillus andaensis]MBP2004069.1 molybdopterin synthase sulfur carrier subunit [Halobacillus andaensis]GGF15556.1 molybdopterin synthase sulfur carrier subunit [Halobacillus andaensis]
MNKILFFAGLQEKMGKQSIEIDASGQSVKQLKDYIEQEYNLSKVHESMVAINEEFAPGEETIKENDTIAFIPPVSGG